MARAPRIFQTIINGQKTKPMKRSFASMEAARADIVDSVAFSKTEDGQTHWGNIVSADIFNKETGETTVVILCQQWQ